MADGAGSGKSESGKWHPWIGEIRRIKKNEFESENSEKLNVWNENLKYFRISYSYDYEKFKFFIFNTKV